MRITKVKVSNYRNIDNILVYLNSNCNYIIGENNLGKSNFFALLDTICHGKSFEDSDFLNPDYPIEIELQLKFTPDESKLFPDNFLGKSTLNLSYTQRILSVHPKILNLDTGKSISIKFMRKINFLRYETAPLPSRELPPYVHENPLIIHKIIEDYTHKNKVSPSVLSVLNHLSDEERRIHSIGNEVPITTIACINLMRKIMELYRSKSSPFSELIFKDSNGMALLPIVLAIDEPELHLHPYLQRSLIGYYKRILQNKDSSFLELIKLCFNIDGLDGQLIIVTHSTDALIGDYRNLVRFYRNNSKTYVISGADPSLNIRPENEKHIIMHFPEIKEAFYAHCAILVEGETEYGCISSFANKLGVSLDDYGICLINARGEGSIAPIRELLNIFAVPSVAMYDGDVKSVKTTSKNSFFTSELCFEIEIVKHLYNNGEKGVVKQIASSIDSRANSIVLDYGFVKKHFKKMGLEVSSYSPKRLSDIDESNEQEFIHMYASWLMAKKGILLGRLIGEQLPDNMVPPCYARAIFRARDISIGK